MTKPTTAQWNQIKTALGGTFGSAYLKCDGHFIAATIGQYKRRLVINCYVDGWQHFSDAKLVKEDEVHLMTEICQKFCHHQRFGRKQAEIKLYEKIYGKKDCIKQGIYKKSLWPVPWFNTPGAFIAKLKKSCTEIEVLDYATYKAGVEAKQVLTETDAPVMVSLVSAE